MGCTSGKVSVLTSEHGGFHEKYNLEHCLGRGAYGTVYLATRAGSAMETAVKIVETGCCGLTGKTSCGMKEMLDFRKEQTMWVRSGQHPNILGLQEWYVDRDFGYFVMQRCESSLLSALRKETCLNEYTYANYFTDMAAALKHLHSREIVHRDVKHDNFLVCGPSGQTVKLCDFGFASMFSQHHELMAERGTIPYMAPETFMPDVPCGAPSDVWSLGVVVYVCLYGCWPYCPEAQTEKEMKRAIRTGAKQPTFRPRSQFYQGRVSGVARDFAQAMLDRDSATRPSAAECLQMPYIFNKERRWTSVQPEEMSNISLSPMLEDAIACGAFSMREPKANPFMDAVLKSLHAKAHGKRAAKAQHTKKNIG